MDYSIGLLKPDCLKRGLEKEILTIIKNAGFEIMATKRVRLTKKEVDIIWAPCLAEDFYEELLNFSTSGDCVVYIVREDNAIDRLSDLVGHYEPTQAKKETIRHQFGISAMENIIHSTSNEKNFWEEARLFFAQSELNNLLADINAKSAI